MRTLIVGSGFVGRAIADHLAGSGHPVVLSSRSPAPGTHPWRPLDVTDPGACRALVDAVQPEAVVAVHGPSDVTWCENNSEQAAREHVAAARNLVAAAPDRRLLLISTDNVFDGRTESFDEHAVPRPANAYGRAKLLAERHILQAAGATVLRVSLVYGWDEHRPGQWQNFFASCVRRLRSGSPVEAPADQWTTPVLAQDVARVAEVVLSGGPHRLLHLGGPDRVSRSDWARQIAASLGTATDQVVAVPSAGTRYACRPTNSCLTSVLLDQVDPSLRIRGVAAGLRELIGSGT
ncbi:SDR family oxidoreductase [Micromonospora schwarzwaldensis]|uniref:SDR family oxidoreductase n=1 Tax=Micromonospora sp. DSM 45708 TaxID=3111767 RepID=UPI0031CF2E8A